MIRRVGAMIGRRIGRSLAAAPGQMGRELARQGRMGSYELGAALFGQSNAYRGDLGLHSVRAAEADPLDQAKARARAAQRSMQQERGRQAQR